MVSTPVVDGALVVRSDLARTLGPAGPVGTGGGAGGLSRQELISFRMPDMEARDTLVGSSLHARLYGVMWTYHAYLYNALGAIGGNSQRPWASDLGQ